MSLLDKPRLSSAPKDRNQGIEIGKSGRLLNRTTTTNFLEVYKVSAIKKIFIVFLLCIETYGLLCIFWKEAVLCSN